MATTHPDTSANEWVTFPGGELEGRRPKALCPACREALQRAAASSATAPVARAGGGGRPRGGPGAHRAGTLCFACYRAELDRQKALAAAGQLDTASDARFQFQLPFEPVDQPRLEMLKAAHRTARIADRATVSGAFVDKRRHAQIEARHALQRIAGALKARAVGKAECDRAMASAFHAAELQLPESWIPFVMSR